MCESSVYVREDGGEKLVLADVVVIRPTADGVHAEDILGRSQQIPGHIEVIDLLNHKVVIRSD